jgi:hypothetical protein
MTSNLKIKQSEDHIDSIMQGFFFFNKKTLTFSGLMITLSPSEVASERMEELSTRY